LNALRTRARDYVYQKKIDKKRVYVYEKISDQVMSRVIRNYNELNRKNSI